MTDPATGRDAYVAAVPAGTHFEDLLTDLAASFVTPLAAYFAEKPRAKLGCRMTCVPDQATAVPLAYDYPGKARGLENIVERSVSPLMRA